MKLRCPACGLEGPLGEFTQAADLLALDRAASVFGADWPLVKEYLALFGGKVGLKAEKMLRLAREVWQMWDSGKFCVGGAWYIIGREEFREALRATCNQAHPGLTNHNYLKKVLLTAARLTSARREKDFKEREKGLMAGRDEIPPDPPLSKGGEVPENPEWAAKFSRLVAISMDAGRSEEERQQAKEAFRTMVKEKTIKAREAVKPYDARSAKDIYKERRRQI